MIDWQQQGLYGPVITIEEMFEGYPNIIPVKGRFVDSTYLLEKAVTYLKQHRHE